ncbi:hypothetical protein EG68_00794 [Paragonimus skrjabini miyazakii]|uniref:Uncharacterized protein n=1 Tax=Paragonimus skrjabini miyazakii TaxID=59628 RepID=A0A8S9Z9L2_9TREM|nr:hypothetical protein EG68_00794 [Paragonimus skrjabini miyazakii]
MDLIRTRNWKILGVFGRTQGRQHIIQKEVRILMGGWCFGYTTWPSMNTSPRLACHQRRDLLINLASGQEANFSFFSLYMYMTYRTFTNLKANNTNVPIFFHEEV